MAAASGTPWQAAYGLGAVNALECLAEAGLHIEVFLHAIGGR